MKLVKKLLLDEFKKFLECEMLQLENNNKIKGSFSCFLYEAYLGHTFPLWLNQKLGPLEQIQTNVQCE